MSPKFQDKRPKPGGRMVHRTPLEPSSLEAYGTRKMETDMLQRTLITLGAVAVAGLALLGFGRQLDRWRRSNLDFEYPIEELFV